MLITARIAMIAKHAVGTPRAVRLIHPAARSTPVEIAIINTPKFACLPSNPSAIPRTTPTERMLSMMLEVLLNESVRIMQAKPNMQLFDAPCVPPNTEPPCT